MLTIYEKATRTILWLGVEADNSIVAMDFVKSTISKLLEEAGGNVVYGNEPGITTWLEDLSNSPQSQSQETWVAIAHLFFRPWFSRTWIV